MTYSLQAFQEVLWSTSYNKTTACIQAIQWHHFFLSVCLPSCLSIYLYRYWRHFQILQSDNHCNIHTIISLHYTLSLTYKKIKRKQSQINTNSLTGICPLFFRNKKLLKHLADTKMNLIEICFLYLLSNMLIGGLTPASNKVSRINILFAHYLIICFSLKIKKKTPLCP